MSKQCSRDLVARPRLFDLNHPEGWQSGNATVLPTVRGIRSTPRRFDPGPLRPNPGESAECATALILNHIRGLPSKTYIRSSPGI
jgi:hypothetical protein